VRRERPPVHAVHPETPSRGLLGAVLERAMRDAIGPLGTGSTACTPSEQVRARHWFRHASVEPMSFRWLCLVLDLDPEAIVRRLEVPSGPGETREITSEVAGDAVLVEG